MSASVDARLAKDQPVTQPWISQKIQNRHLQRIAVVYVRQSTLHQLMANQESTALQYGLVNRAQALGWKKDRVVVIDDDQGRSAQSTEGRLGFQKLLAEVSLDHVGLILGIEMSRLARSNKDWHQLLELCSIFRTLLADQDGLYDPTDYNDRLLLGLKGTMSEAELHILKARMYEGKINKAKRGELLSRPPIGYVQDDHGSYALDPDEQVQSVIKLMFEKFRELGSLNAVLRFCVANKIRIGVRPYFGLNQGKLEWRRVSRSTLQNMLTHPMYAGAYRYGYRWTDPRCKIPGRPSTGRKILRYDKCMVLIKNRFPAYISWKQFEENVEKLKQNRAIANAMGVPREGSALLGGLIICGRCGARMNIHYEGKNSIPHYICVRDHGDYGEPRCQSLRGNSVDELVSQQVLKIIEPASLELSLTASQQLKKENEKLFKHWNQRLERVQYEVNRAHRQFEAVEPENRLVARELERRWESALLEQKKLQEDFERFYKQQISDLTEEEQIRILRMSSDVRKLWNEPTTTPQDKQNIIRLLLRRAVITVQGETEKVKVHLQWVGGYTSEHEVIRPIARYTQLSYYESLLDQITELHHQGLQQIQIADQLNSEGWSPARGAKAFNKQIVRELLSRRGKLKRRRPGSKSHEYLKPHEYWLGELAGKLEIPRPTIYAWLRRGWLKGRQLEGPQGQWVLWADSNELTRLRKLRESERSWLDQPISSELTIPKKKRAA